MNFSLINSVRLGKFAVKLPWKRKKTKTSKDILGSAPERLAGVLLLPAKYIEITGLVESQTPDDCDVWLFDDQLRCISLKGPLIRTFLINNPATREHIYSVTHMGFRAAFDHIFERTLKGQRMKCAAIVDRRQFLITTFPIPRKKGVIGFVVICQPASAMLVTPSGSAFCADSPETSTEESPTDSPAHN